MSKKKKISDAVTAKQYQSATHQFAIFPEKMALEYLSLGLVSEAGEVAGKAKKLIRGDYVEVAEELDSAGRQQMRINLEAFHKDLWSEMSDVCWYLSELCNLTGTDLEHLFADNIKKLSARKTAETLKGSGDAR